MALFQNSDGPALKQMKLERVKQQINNLFEEYLRTTDDEQLVAMYVAEHHVEVPVMNYAGANIDHAVGSLDVDDYGDRRTVQGEIYKIDVPFTGDKNVLFMRPGPWDTGPPHANVVEQKLWLEYTGANLTEEQVTAEFKRWMEKMETYLAWHRQLWGDLDSMIEQTARAALLARRKKLGDVANKAAGIAKALGISLREKPGDPKTFAPPVVREKVAAKLPPTKPNAPVPDPTLERAVYDSIVNILRGAGRSIERSASAIRKHPEEVLRDILLIPLNSHFEGQASGEAFNKEGKTDIAIRHEKQNLFIAECKVWGGAKLLTDAIDQLFKYLAWRDSKAAIIIFNRNVGFTDVLEKTLETAKAHPGFVKVVKKLDDSTWECEFKYPTDPAKMITVTIMVFDMGTGDAAP